MPQLHEVIGIPRYTFDYRPQKFGPASSAKLPSDYEPDKSGVARYR